MMLGWGMALGVSLWPAVRARQRLRAPAQQCYRVWRAHKPSSKTSCSLGAQAQSHNTWVTHAPGRAPYWTAQSTRTAAGLWIAVVCSRHLLQTHEECGLVDMARLRLRGCLRRCLGQLERAPHQIACHQSVHTGALLSEPCAVYAHTMKPLTASLVDRGCVPDASDATPIESHPHTESESAESSRCGLHEFDRCYES